LLAIYIDADACPVKGEIYRIARRHELKVFVVAHGSIHVPPKLAGSGRVETIRVKPGFDAADDWIAQHAGSDDVVVTADIPLAARCLKNQARVLSPSGEPFSEESIGDALATRDLMEQLRQAGVQAGGPAPFAPADRSRFVSALSAIIQDLRSGNPRSRTPSLA
jgi:uncharacterized protein YaiI (UPF0178 family)